MLAIPPHYWTTRHHKPALDTHGLPSHGVCKASPSSHFRYSNVAWHGKAWVVFPIGAAKSKRFSVHGYRFPRWTSGQQRKGICRSWHPSHVICSGSWTCLMLDLIPVYSKNKHVRKNTTYVSLIMKDNGWPKKKKLWKIMKITCQFTSKLNKILIPKLNLLLWR